MGQCIITEIQWNIKDLYGHRPKTESYIQYWIKHKLGIDANESAVDKLTTAIYAITFLRTIFINHKTMRIAYENHYYESTRAKQALGFTPRPLDETINDTTNWYNNEYFQIKNS